MDKEIRERVNSNSHTTFHSYLKIVLQKLKTKQKHTTHFGKRSLGILFCIIVLYMHVITYIHTYHIYIHYIHIYSTYIHFIHILHTYVRTS